MHRARRAELLDYATFKRYGGHVSFVEAWQSLGAEDRVEEGRLSDSSIEQWLSRNDNETPKAEPDRESSETRAGVRLLFCPRTSYIPVGFAVSKEIFEKIEDAWRLPLSTLEATFNYTGVFAQYFTLAPEGSNQEDRLGLVLKFPQSFHAGSYMIALSYDPNSRVTKAFLHAASKSERERISASLNASSSLWQHPLLVPVILFENHLQNAERYLLALSDKVTDMEADTGYVVAGRLALTDPSAIPKWNKLDLEGLTRRLHSCLAELVFLDHVSHFRRECAGFLLKTIKDVQRHFPAHGRRERAWEARELAQSIGFMSSASDTMWYQSQCLQKRVQSQIGVTYSMIAQNDSRLNQSIASDSAQIASASKRDSSAMKTVALITAIFLPGTFVATFFSMSMFEWQGTLEQSERRMVSPYLWIYFVVTIPFTLMVIFTWRFWWRHEEQTYQDEVRKSQRGDSSPSDAVESGSSGNDLGQMNRSRRETILSNMTDEAGAGTDTGGMSRRLRRAMTRTHSIKDGRRENSEHHGACVEMA
ncbi:MAG: hypothetical protein M1833_005596 [Piccolia ochrophora]|nr:MAG: hypothetical protein M1833_005596 [Piccolia ochrophora]